MFREYNKRFEIVKESTTITKTIQVRNHKKKRINKKWLKKYGFKTIAFETNPLYHVHNIISEIDPFYNVYQEKLGCRRMTFNNLRYAEQWISAQ